MSEDGLAALRGDAARIRLEARGILEVAGDDRARWLDGMLTNAVVDLAPGTDASGCPALALTRQGRIVADPHVLARPDAFWLELERDAIPTLLEHLDGFLVADDVELRDVSADFVRMALEGPGALGAWQAAGQPAPPPDGAVDTELGGARVVAAGYSLSGLGGIQLVVPAPDAERVWDALGSVVGAEAAADALELARIEQGVPRLGREITTDVLPAEVRLEGAVSETKGCYTGQEVVARMRSRDRVSHLLVGLRFDGAAPAAGGTLEHDGRRRGEVTSAAVSDRFGAIGLGYVTRALAEPGTSLTVDGSPVHVVALPFGDSASERATQ